MNPGGVYGNAVPFRPVDTYGEAVLPRSAVPKHCAAPFDYFIDLDDDYSVARDLATGYERAWARRQDAIVREMLGRWVSEIEPCIIVCDTHVVGLGMAGDPAAQIIVRPTKEPA